MLFRSGIYDTATYLTRSRNISERIVNCLRAIENTKDSILYEMDREQAAKEIIPKVENVLKLYNSSKDPAQKNSLLKSVLEKAVYIKEQHKKNDDFLINLYPKLLK